MSYIFSHSLTQSIHFIQILQNMTEPKLVFIAQPYIFWITTNALFVKLKGQKSLTHSDNFFLTLTKNDKPFSQHMAFKFCLKNYALQCQNNSTYDCEAAGGLGAEPPASFLRRSRPRGLGAEPQEHCQLSCFGIRGQNVAAIPSVCNVGVLPRLYRSAGHDIFCLEIIQNFSRVQHSSSSLRQFGPCLAVGVEHGEVGHNNGNRESNRQHPHEGATGPNYHAWNDYGYSSIGYKDGNI